MLQIMDASLPGTVLFKHGHPGWRKCLKPDALVPYLKMSPRYFNWWHVYGSRDRFCFICQGVIDKDTDYINESREIEYFFCCDLLTHR